ncbi:hypothetical protein ZOSMA_42G00220 [Zostera marina]|uniref:Matrin-type domain-containing protein n=1 Tax=Zostera marina TaxID=29655 RepID=A0A0K9P1N4_ZOSMR|nr:hypothetical protein ZOSMA_42G00220 [Zostera marina]
MTEYWVSQGNKWCDFCKIFITNNPLSIRTHDLGTKHKECVAKRLSSMRKESAAKEKEQKDAVKALAQIESKANSSYQKDLASFKAGSSSNQQSGGFPAEFSKNAKDWEYDAASGYYYNLTNGYYYDSNSRLYYTNEIGKWVKHEEAFPASHVANNASVNKGGSPPGLVVSKSPKSGRSVKGVPSSIGVGKRKRADDKPKVVSKEEVAALKAREAARKRVDEREKNLLGLYNSY